MNKILAVLAMLVVAGCDGGQPPGSARPSLAMGVGAPQGGPRLTAGTNITIDPVTGVISASGGGGYSGNWSAGTYNAGAVTSVASNFGGCPWLFAATTTTTKQPCYDYSDVTGASWARNNVFSTNNGVITLIAASTSTSANMIGKTAATGWGSKRYVVDVSISGSADALGFGFLDGSLSSTQSGSIGGITGAYGAELDMFNARVFPIVNGVADHTKDVAAGQINNSHSAGAIDTYFDRWYLDVVDNGAGAGTATFSLYRNMYTAAISSPYTGSPSGASVDGVKIFATWTVPRPSFTTWVPIISARTGGASGTFVVERAFVRDTSGDWKPIAMIPDRI